GSPIDGVMDCRTGSADSRAVSTTADADIRDDRGGMNHVETKAMYNSDGFASGLVQYRFRAGDKRDRAGGRNNNGVTYWGDLTDLSLLESSLGMVSAADRIFMRWIFIGDNRRSEQQTGQGRGHGLSAACSLGGIAPLTSLRPPAVAPARAFGT